MIEKKCQICGEWCSSKKIAMHYWNIHKKKYGEFKDNNEETRITEEKAAEVETVKEEPIIETKPVEPEPIVEEVVEQPIKIVDDTVINQEEYVLEPSKTDYTAFNRADVEKRKEEIKTTPYHIDEDPTVINEVYRPRNVVEKPDIYGLDEGEVINEWC